jgi:hypothetical protein
VQEHQVLLVEVPEPFVPGNLLQAGLAPAAPRSLDEVDPQQGVGALHLGGDAAMLFHPAPDLFVVPRRYRFGRHAGSPVLAAT